MIIEVSQMFKDLMGSMVNLALIILSLIKQIELETAAIGNLE